MVIRAIQLQNDCKILFALLVSVVSVVPMSTAQNTLSPMAVTPEGIYALPREVQL